MKPRATHFKIQDRMVDGVATSLCDLGYCDVGLDDNWQECGSGALHFHDKDGNPIVNTKRFPDFNKMTDHAHKLGLTSGWWAPRPLLYSVSPCSLTSMTAHRRFALSNAAGTATTASAQSVRLRTRSSMWAT